MLVEVRALRKVVQQVVLFAGNKIGDTPHSVDAWVVAARCSTGVCSHHNDVGVLVCEPLGESSVNEPDSFVWGESGFPRDSGSQIVVQHGGVSYLSSGGCERPRATLPA